MLSAPQTKFHFLCLNWCEGRKIKEIFQNLGKQHEFKSHLNLVFVKSMHHEDILPQCRRVNQLCFALLFHCSQVHAISGPPAAPALFFLFALSSFEAAGLPGLFVLISSMFAKELTSGDRSPCVFFCDAERTRPSEGIGELDRDYMLYGFNTHSPHLWYFSSLLVLDSSVFIPS